MWLVGVFMSGLPIGIFAAIFLHNGNSRQGPPNPLGAIVTSFLCPIAGLRASRSQGHRRTSEVGRPAASPEKIECDHADRSFPRCVMRTAAQAGEQKRRPKSTSVFDIRNHIWENLMRKSPAVSRGIGRTIVLVSAVAACMAASGCGPSAVEFNNKFALAQKRVIDAYKPAGQALGKQPQDFKAAREALDNSKKMVEAARAEMPTWKVPTSQSAKNLYEGFERYLKSHEDYLVQVHKFIDVLEKKNGDRRLIEKMGADVDAAEQSEISQILNLQKAFANEHHFILK
jgi:hypothetical protein